MTTENDRRRELGLPGGVDAVNKRWRELAEQDPVNSGRGKEIFGFLANLAGSRSLENSLAQLGEIEEPLKHILAELGKAYLGE